ARDGAVQCRSAAAPAAGPRPARGAAAPPRIRVRALPPSASRGDGGSISPGVAGEPRARAARAASGPGRGPWPDHQRRTSPLTQQLAYSATEIHPGRKARRPVRGGSGRGRGLGVCDGRRSLREERAPVTPTSVRGPRPHGGSLILFVIAAGLGCARYDSPLVPDPEVTFAATAHEGRGAPVGWRRVRAEPPVAPVYDGVLPDPTGDALAAATAVALDGEVTWIEEHPPSGTPGAR